MKKVIFATGNEGKMKEIRMILADVDVEVLSLKDAGIVSEVVENGATFEENAGIKAKAALQEAGKAGFTDFIVLADDSGLEIDALNKEPGIYSARYMGEDTSYRIKNKNLIDRLAGKTGAERSARFVCAIAAAVPGQDPVFTRGVIEGRIDFEEKGENGFGYDPIFYIPEFGCTSAQLEPSKKNEASHRGKALRKMKEHLLSENKWLLKNR